jgi:hypothetical protein
MVMIGIFQAIIGLAAILENEFLAATPNYVFELDATAWGWAHLILGIVMLLAASGLYSGAVWARTLGVIIALISAVANFAFIPRYPVWSILIVAIDVTVIWALTVHGRDLAIERGHDESTR